MHQQMLHVVQKSAQTMRLWCGKIKKPAENFLMWLEHIGFFY